MITKRCAGLHRFLASGSSSQHELPLPLAGGIGEAVGRALASLGQCLCALLAWTSWRRIWPLAGSPVPDCGGPLARWGFGRERAGADAARRSPAAGPAGGLPSVPSFPRSDSPPQHRFPGAQLAKACDCRSPRTFRRGRWGPPRADANLASGDDEAPAPGGSCAGVRSPRVRSEGALREQPVDRSERGCDRGRDGSSVAHQVDLSRAGSLSPPTS